MELDSRERLWFWPRLSTRQLPFLDRQYPLGFRDSSGLSTLLMELNT